MLIKGHYFPGQKRTEKVELFIRRHWVTYVPWISLIGLLVLLPWIINGIFNAIGISLIDVFNDLVNITEINTNDRWINYITIVILSSYYLFLAAYFLKMWIDYYLDIIIVTPGHLANIQQIGLLNHKVSEQSLLRVQDVTARVSGFWQTFFRYGTVVAETAGDEPNFMMKNVPNPNSVASIVLKLHDELVESGGLEEELSEGVGLNRPKSVVEKRKGMINKIVYNLPPSRAGNTQKRGESREEFFSSEATRLEQPFPPGESRVVIIKPSRPMPKTTVSTEKSSTKKIKKVERISTSPKKSESFEIESSWLTENPKKQKGKTTEKKTEKIEQGELKEGEEIKL